MADKNELNEINKEIEDGSENSASGTENGSEKDTREYYEREYFEGDALREAESDDDDEEEDEFLKSFDKAASVSEKTSSGLKSQLIILGSVFAAAAVLLCLYFFVFKKEENIGTGDRQYYGLSDSCINTLSGIDEQATISFSASKETLEKSEYGTYISAFAESFEHFLNCVKLEYGTGTEYCVVSYGGKSMSFSEADFFNTLEDGTRFSFNGEKLYGTAILKVISDKTAEDNTFAVWALPGYDLDGDIVNSSSNRPFMFKSTNRANVDYITVTNSYGTYKVYRIHNTDGTASSAFYFEGAEFCEYDQEKFASLIVNCTYVLATGKVPSPGDLADYGLGSASEANAVVDVYLLDGTHHRILLGDEIPSGGGYYAAYDGKPHVYILDSTYNDNILQPVTSLLTANLGYVITNTNETYNVDEVFIKYKTDNTDVYIAKKQDLAFSSNVVCSSEKKTPNELLHDKSRFNGDYTDWTKNEIFCGIKQTDSEPMQVQFQLTNYAAETNEYSFSFGLVYDTAANAGLPVEVIVYAYDPDKAVEGDSNSAYVEVAKLSAAGMNQADGSFKRYTLPFTYEKQLRSVRVRIKTAAGVYAVFDEMTVYADGKDAIPNEAVTGVWKIVAPTSYIRPGTNYSIPDTSSFAEILYGITTLIGDEVVEYNIYSGDEAKTQALLEKYGLKDPETIVYYSYQGYKTYLYFSPLISDEKTNEKWYYSYATINYTDENGTEYGISTNIIAKINYDNAVYLSWKPVDLLDRAAFSMYIDKIDTIEMEFEGESYLFDLQDTDENGKMDTVAYKDGFVDVPNFRNVYVSVLRCSRAGTYTPNDDDISEKNIIMRFTMNSDVKDTEIIFYRVSATKVIYQIDGAESEFYVLYSDVSLIMSNVKKLVAGEEVPD